MRDLPGPARLAGKTVSSGRPALLPSSVVAEHGLGEVTVSSFFCRHRRPFGRRPPFLLFIVTGEKGALKATNIATARPPTSFSFMLDVLPVRFEVPTTDVSIVKQGPCRMYRVPRDNVCFHVSS